jgi:hypothetical protein
MFPQMFAHWWKYCRLSKVRSSWFLEATDFCHPQARQIHRCIFAPVTSVNAHYYSVLTTPFDMVNAHYVINYFSLRFKIRQVTQVARFRLSQALLGKSRNIVAETKFAS